MGLFNTHNFLNSFIFAPFFFAFILSFNTIIESPGFIRNITRFFFLCQTIASLCLLLFFGEHSFSVFNFAFSLDITSSILLFLNNLIFLLFSIISRTFILQLHRIFFVCNLLICGLINIFLLSDNITISLAAIFWMFLAQYFLSMSYCEKQDKKYIVRRFLSDILCYGTALFLICYDFVRYFVLNKIAFNYSLIAENLTHISDFSSSLAFFGFLLLAFRFLNFAPFNGNNFKTNSLVSTQNTLCFLVLGGYLLIKIYLIFDYLFFEYENAIIMYLIANFIYYLMLCLKCRNIIKFVANLLPVYTITALFSLFSYDSIGLASFIYFVAVACLSYCFTYFVAILLEYRYQSSDIETWGRILDKSRLTQFFTAVSFLNLAWVPLLPMFTSGLVSLAAIFSVEYEKSIFNMISFILVLGVLVVCVSVFGVIYKVLIMSSLKPGKEFILAKHQIITFTILLMVLIIIGLYPQYLFSELAIYLEGGF